MTTSKMWISAVASALFLSGTFLGLTLWFQARDFYHQDFFSHGFSVFEYNLGRIVFLCFLGWIIYAPGYAVISGAVKTATLQTFSFSERIVLGFGTGVFVWHTALLVLGLSGFYFTSLMMALCVVVLLASGAHFNSFMREAFQLGSQRLKSLDSGNALGSAAAVVLIIFAAAWLLLVRGLYPGGGGDYYTHYFYYYQEVVKNHGLQPNDVWYHYYYSKGAGLFFLGIVLTDPEAPQLVTFLCVAVAMLALASLSARIAPKSLWPAFSAVLYLIYYVVSLRGDGGEFQKLHEEISALVVIATWAICMYALRPKEWERPCIILAAAVVAGAAILTQAIGVFLGVFFAVCATEALITKSFRRMWAWVILGASASGAVLAVLLLNYFVTGLATDQALDLTWRFANLDRLADWGVIAQVAVVAWIRDNYIVTATPSWWDTPTFLKTAMRLDALWLPVGSCFIAFAIALALKFKTSFYRIPSDESAEAGTKRYSASLVILFYLGMLLITLSLLSAFMGRTQAVSYTRFSTFFFPLITLFVVACWGTLIAFWEGRQQIWILRQAIPLVLLVAVPATWTDWWPRAELATANAWDFVSGRYSLADAYSHQIGGLPFGAINPAVWKAAQQVEPGTRIWSTNVDSYCLVPDCRIESVVSFKMSSRLNEILNGTPEEARHVLQEEGLNYFLFSTKHTLLDMLPYSRLFAMDTIGNYLGIKWTDGSTYLLTWRGPGIAPIGPAFLSAYKERLDAPEHPWFEFSKFVGNLNTLSTGLKAIPHPWHPVEFPWRRDSLGIQIVSATYGGSCSEFRTARPGENRVFSGNATATISRVCKDKTRCDFLVDANELGDPAPGCAKNLAVTYKCSKTGVTEFIAGLQSEALGKTLEINCEPKATDGISVVAATYGGNCEASALGNATIMVGNSCSGKNECSFDVDVNRLGDAAPGCRKDFTVQYLCSSGNSKSAYISREANGKKVNLSCVSKSN